MREQVHRTFGSSLSLQSSAARSSTKDIPYLEGERTSLSSNVPLTRLSVAEVVHDASSGELFKSSKQIAVWSNLIYDFSSKIEMMIDLFSIELCGLSFHFLYDVPRIVGKKKNVCVCVFFFCVQKSSFSE